MEVADSVYKQLARQLLDIFNENGKHYFSGYVVVEKFTLAISCVFYDEGDIVPVWWEYENKYDFEFDKLRTKYKELCKR